MGSAAPRTGDRATTSSAAAAGDASVTIERRIVVIIGRDHRAPRAATQTPDANAHGRELLRLVTRAEASRPPTKTGADPVPGPPLEDGVVYARAV